MKVETHNHPTAIAPDPGAATGCGGEIRDEAATGRGARTKAGLCGFSVSNLRLPGYEQPWEIDHGRPQRVASARQIMLEAPIPATLKALERAGMKIGDIDLYEVNEAFASVPTAWLKVTGGDPAKLNVNGGAIALGHPLGATGAIRTATLLHGLRRRQQKYGMVTMCIGTGMGAAGIFEAL